MPTTSILERPAHDATPPRSHVLLAVAVLATGAVIAALVTSALDAPEQVDLTIDNPTDYDFNVTVRPADGGSSLGIGQLQSRSTHTYRSVNDQGGEWRIEFAYAGVDAAGLTVTRSEITAGEIVVPSSAAEKLRRAGIEPPP